jgi:signal peptidase I
MSHAGERRRTVRRGKGKQRSFLAELPIILLVALVLSLLIKTFFIQAFFIPSSSMEQTLLIGDRVFVNKLATRFGDIERGDVVVFQDPGGWLAEQPEEPAGSRLSRGLRDAMVFVGLAPSADEDDLIKRVIGVGGDHVVCCDAQGRVSVNDVALAEPYVFPGDTPSELEFDVTVPRASIWVMGDHRGVSEDSRYHQDDERGGMVPLDNVIGRAFVVVWPLNRLTGIGRPEVFDTPGLDRG